MTVATNRYIEYWKQMVRTADAQLFPGHDVVMHVFTDQPDVAREMDAELSRVSIDPVEIEPYGWPEATLLRYEIFDTHRGRLNEDVLMHLDADMAVVAPVGPDLHSDQWEGGIALVRHPGFRRPSGLARIGYYSKDPRALARDALMQSRVGGFGSWESDPSVRAHVPRANRRTYVCGGTWMGRREPLLSMIGELSARTRADLDEAKIAVWHDESHLNWYAAGHPFTLLGSEYCHAQGFTSVADIAPLIVALDKGDARTR